MASTSTPSCVSQSPPRAPSASDPSSRHSWRQRLTYSFVLQTAVAQGRFRGCRTRVRSERKADGSRLTRSVWSVSTNFLFDVLEVNCAAAYLVAPRSTEQCVASVCSNEHGFGTLPDIEAYLLLTVRRDGDEEVKACWRFGTPCRTRCCTLRTWPSGYSSPSSLPGKWLSKLSGCWPDL